MKNLKWLVFIGLTGLGVAAAQAESGPPSRNTSSTTAPSRKGAEALVQLPTKAKAKGSAANARPAEAPRPLTVKEQRLADLATAYRANLLTPDQYQKERARIMAQP
jgi:hypothetical protein